MDLNKVFLENLVEDKKHEHLHLKKKCIKCILLNTLFNTVITYCLFCDSVIQ